MKSIFHFLFIEISVYLFDGSIVSELYTIFTYMMEIKFNQDCIRIVPTRGDPGLNKKSNDRWRRWSSFINTEFDF